MNKLFINNAKIKAKFYYFVSFLYGFVLMSVEMLGSRMLAPYFGSDIFVWANLIGIFLLSISLGSFIGGKLSLKNNILFIISIISIFLMLYIAITYKGIFKWISGWFTGELVEHGQNPSYGDRIIKPLSAAIIVFFPLILSLSMISPIIIKKLTLNLEESGKVSGRVYAVSTLGNLFGTFFTSFYLIIKFRTTTIFYVFFAIFILNIIIILIFQLDKVNDQTD